MWRPGKLRFLIGVKNPLPIDRPRPPENTAPYGPPPVARFATPVGLRPPFVTHPATLSHPDWRAFLILFAAQHLLDWLVNRSRVWKRPHLAPVHLLRQVFQCARDFAEAKAMLSEMLIALPAIYLLAGLGPDEACVIEGLPDRAHVIDGPICAANAWQLPGWCGRSHGED